MTKPKLEEGQDPSILISDKLQSVRWRLNNLYWIQDIHGIKIKFRMNVVQEAFFKLIWWLNDVLKSRQHGISTFTGLLQLDQCLFNRDQTAGIVDKTDKDATKKLDKIKFAYDHLDDTDNPGEGHVDTSKLGAAIKEAVVEIKRNDHEFNWTNGSKIWTGTSLRGGTCQFLHITELGAIAANYPARAEEIRAGAFNTVHVGCKIVIESTHEGGQAGLNYEMIDLAMTSPPREHMSKMDWQFHFFAWWQDPKNSLQLTRQGLMLSDEEKVYFLELEREQDIPLAPEQKHWYQKKKATQKDAMFKEHPSTAEEALNAAVKGAIYGKQLTALKKANRVRDFAHDTQAPLYTFWDLGKTDFTSIWLIQFTGMEYTILNYFSWNGEEARFYAAKINEWENEYGFISGHYLPHDAKNNSGPGLTWLQAYQEAGLKNLVVVPVTPDQWIGIRHLRGLLPRCWIHKTNCSKKWKIEDGVIIPSGLAVLQGYRTRIQETGGRIDEMPVHDECSHGADALRTFAEAHQRGMLKGHTPLEREMNIQKRTRVITGVHGNTDDRSFRRTRKPRVLR